VALLENWWSIFVIFINTYLGGIKQHWNDTLNRTALFATRMCFDVGKGMMTVKIHPSISVMWCGVRQQLCNFVHRWSGGSTVRCVMLSDGNWLLTVVVRTVILHTFSTAVGRLPVLPYIKVIAFLHPLVLYSTVCYAWGITSFYPVILLSSSKSRSHLDKSDVKLGMFHVANRCAVRLEYLSWGGRQ
jgi:hypothetical protein